MESQEVGVAPGVEAEEGLCNPPFLLIALCDEEASAV